MNALLRASQWVWAAVIVGSSLVASGCGVPSDRTVAMAGNMRITRGELDRALASNQVLQGVRLGRTVSAQKSQATTLAEQRLVIRWAQSHHLMTASQAAHTAQEWVTGRIATSFGGAAGLSRRLSTNHLSLGYFEQYLQGQVILQCAFDHITQAVPAPSLAYQLRYYEDNTVFFKAPGEVLLRNITVPTQREAESVLAQIKKGSSFSALAIRDSRDPDRMQGGSRGWVAVGGIHTGVPLAWLGALAGIAPNHMRIVKSALGYSIIEVQASRAGATVPFHAVQPVIQDELVQSAKAAMFDKWAANLVHNKIRLFVT